MVDDYDGFMESNFQGPENSVKVFYDKLSDMQSIWTPLENTDQDYTYYKNTEMGTLALGQLTSMFQEWPTLEYFNHT